MYTNRSNTADFLLLLKSIIVFTCAPKISEDRYFELKNKAQELSLNRHIQERTGCAQRETAFELLKNQGLNGIREKLVFMSNLLIANDEMFLDRIIERRSMDIASDRIWDINYDLQSTFFAISLKSLELYKYKEYLGTEIEEKINLCDKILKTSARQKKF